MKNILIKVTIGICLVMSLVLIVGIVFHLYTDNKINDEYYSIFLDNNQVYFGKIASRNNDFLTLTNVYYLKLNINKKIDNKADLVLYKLGQELHAPKDKLIINMSHVLYFGELQADSQVVQVIEGKKKK